MELPALGTTIAGKYQLQSVIGEGGMGRVYRAHHELMDKRVALKVMRPAFEADFQVAKARFLREAQAAARIRHPNVVEVYDVGVDGALLFMVMEHLEGAPFTELMLGDDVSLQDKLALLLEAMHGIAAAHEQGIVHRDIKPDNIFVARRARAPERVAKVLDFGISKLRDEAMQTSVTESGIAIGTPIYMSSEQMHGARDVDARTDIYSMGVVLYETLTGELPFDGDTPAAIAVKMHTASPRSLRALRPELPAVLEHVVLKAMSVRREQRYESMNALIGALEASLPELQRAPLRQAARVHTTAEAIAPTMPTPTASAAAQAAKARSSRKRWSVALAGAVLAAGVAGYQATRPAANEARAPAVLPAAPVSAPPAAVAPSAEPVRVALPEPVKDAGVLDAHRARRHAQRVTRAVAKKAEPAPVAPAAPVAPVTTEEKPARAARGLRSGELRPDDL